MKQRVDLSTFSFIATVVTMVIFIFLIFYNHPPLHIQIPLIAVLVIISIVSLFYTPVSIGADEDAIYIIRSLRTKIIPLSEVKSVRLCPPTMGAIKICASGGFMGYWGWFRERDLGKYFAYYGRSSDCFLVELHNGRKYMLGCRNPKNMVEYINQALTGKHFI